MFLGLVWVVICLVLGFALSTPKASQFSAQHFGKFLLRVTEHE